MKKPQGQLHPDLAAVIRELLDRSPQPLNVTKLRSQLTGPFKAPPKLKDALVALLMAEVQAGHIEQWPADKYWTRDSRSWAEPLMIAAASAAPVASSKVTGAVSKQYGRPAAEALLAELIESGRLVRVPLFGGAKGKVCSRIENEAAFRAELDAARRVIEAGYRRLGHPLPDGRGSEETAGSTSLTVTEPPVDELVLDALASLEPRKGLLVTAPRLYRALPDTAKSEIDAALIGLQDARRVILHRHSNPQSQSPEELITGLYVGACWRVQE